MRLPWLDHPGVRLSMLFSKALSKRVQKLEGLRGLTSARFSDADLKRLQRRWLEDEMRTKESWDELVKTFDLTRQYRVGRTAEHVDLPLTIRAGGREQLLLLATGTDNQTDSLPRYVIQQLTTRGDLIGGSTFIFRQARG
jgi:hypothetical protein